MNETTIRKRRTPAEIAQGKLDKAAKALNREIGYRDHQREVLRNTEANVERLTKLHTLAAEHPDLPPVQTVYDEPAGDQAAPHEDASWLEKTRPYEG